jgi:putative ABC transport system ATP-binding protein
MLKLENIHVSFGNLEVLAGLNCHLNAGDFVAIMGCNGAGKSTLFDVIAGTTKPDRGRILLDGEDITEWSETQRAPLIGRLFQNTRLASVSTLTVRENLALATLKGRSAGLRHGLSHFPEKVIDKILRPLNLRLEELLDRPMGTLSGGQRQIVSFIMATLVPPRILLLDEPTAALDPKSATELLLFAKEFVREHGIPTVMITHDPEIARHTGNKLWVIEKGKLRFVGDGEGDLALLETVIHPVDYKRLSAGEDG